jgi:SAM-dependent methyltransferase
MRLSSYLEQFRLLDKNDNSASVLEIGKGPGIFGYIVKQCGYEYKSVDIDKNTGPDIVADVQHLPVEDNSYDHVYCCQVLEHLEFSCFEKAITELIRVARKKVIISLPDNRHYLKFGVDLCGVKKKCVWSVPFTGRDVLKNPPSHRWEIGDGKFIRNIRIKQVLELMGSCLDERKIVSHYRLYENPYHHYFVITKDTREK